MTAELVGAITPMTGRTVNRVGALVRNLNATVWALSVLFSVSEIVCPAPFPGAPRARGVHERGRWPVN